MAVLLLAVLSELLPAIAWVPRWTNLSRSLRLAAAHNALGIIAGPVGVALALRHMNNLWLGHALLPFYATFALLALAAWQRTPAEARALRLLAAVFVIFWAVATLRLENLHRFSNYARPLYDVLTCVGAAYTLLRQSMVADRPLTEESWFWVCAAWMLVGSSEVVLEPVANLLLAAGSPLVYVLHPTKAVFGIAANVLLTIGFLRQQRRSAPAALVLT
jgi:hypothetical protein